MNSTMPPEQSRLRRTFGRLVVLWLLVIATLMGWNFWLAYRAALENARSTAAESVHKDVLYRSWATLHGGVYAPVSAQTPPNPDLAGIPERDILTPSGRQLTLLNPAYMTRQVHELGNKENGSRGHLTSLNPLRGANAPDAWEQQALRTFEQGGKEFYSIETLDGTAYFRYMRPLLVEPACLKCHAKQGYQVGDVRGGLSASILWAPYRNSLASQLAAGLLGFGGICALGLFGLRRARARLERDLEELKTVHARLAQSQVRLLQSEKMAAVGQLAAGVAHEINNPIGFVNSNMGTLKDYLDKLLALLDAYEQHTSAKSVGDLNALQAAGARADIAYLRDDAQALLNESLDGLDRVKRIVQSLRDFSRAGMAQWEESDLIAGLESTLTVAQSQIQAKAQVIKHCAALPRVRCNQAQINQVFLSLLVNAAQAIDGKGTIEISSGVEDSWVWVAVQDSGPGVRPDIQHRIFEPFFTTRPVGEGMGLGLALAYDIVRQHEGRIELHSAPDKGARFVVWLPVAGPLNLKPERPPADDPELWTQSAARPATQRREINTPYQG